MKAPYKILPDQTIETSLRGASLMMHPLLNKGRSFTDKERDEFALRGLLPPHIVTLEEQAQHLYKVYQKQDTPLRKHIFLRALQDRNEVLFYRLLLDHIGEMLQIVYTPVVGEACQKFSEIYRKPRGLFIAYPDRDKIDEILDNCYLTDVKAIVVTDGGRILGLGDQGAGGMGIPIGKMSLYTACGGLNPAYNLPILLDVGTNNQERLDDPDYLGWRHKRIGETEYLDFIDKFVQAIKRKFPNVLLQWEDFAKEHATLLLDKYRTQICSFNDDVQGTAAISTAAILAGVKALKQSIKDQRVVIFGAGSAGTGIATQIVNAMAHEGLDKKLGRNQIWLIDRDGLVMDTMANLASFQKPFAKQAEQLKGWKRTGNKAPSFLETVANVKPTILIGVSGVQGGFTQEVILEMQRHVERPIILPLSNPDANCEAKPVDLFNWTKGKAIVATGTKFPNVTYEGKTYEIGQSNNHYIFPSMALGIIASGARQVSEDMFLAAALKLAEYSPIFKNPTASLFPPPEQIPNISKEIAVVVGQQAAKEAFCPKCTEEQLRKKINDIFWTPKYFNMVYTGNKEKAAAFR